MWGDTCGSVCKFPVQPFQYSGGRPNRRSPLKFRAAYSLVIFFNSEFLMLYFRIFLSFHYLIKYFQLNFFRANKMSSEKSQENHSRRNSQEGKRLQICVGYLDWSTIQNIKKVQQQTCRLHRRCRPEYKDAIIYSRRPA
jgi:hypothetical protein